MRILIEVPTYDGRISQATSESLWRLDRCGHVVDYRPRPGYGCDMARNRIAADAICAGYDRVLMVDNDIAFKPDALGNLLEHDAPVAMGYYVNRHPRGNEQLVCAYKLGFGWDMYDTGELREFRDKGVKSIRIKGGGMGFCLLKTEVFERVRFPWYKWSDFAFKRHEADDVYGCRDDFTSGGEDIEFCNKLASAGIPVLLDTRVYCGHEVRKVVWAD